jgi:hypothetical protein
MKKHYHGYGIDSEYRVKVNGAKKKGKRYPSTSFDAQSR